MSILRKMLITSIVFELQVRFNTQIEDNSKMLPNLVLFFKFYLPKVEIYTFEVDVILLI